MKINEAIKACKEGHFVTHINFDSTQSMHMYKNSLYYEDGANLTSSIFDIFDEEWAKDGWRIKFENKQVDFDKLNDMHIKSNGYMLDSDKSYENCINR